MCLQFVSDVERWKRLIMFLFLVRSLGWMRCFPRNVMSILQTTFIGKALGRLFGIILVFLLKVWLAILILLGTLVLLRFLLFKKHYLGFALINLIML
ncbi:hypothetical protein Golax_008857 [Gossypium laxum]|uniref:Uncharacterized protein n=1 Tax=Gossypium laxum TaxID=34288 RepID=A0A7J9AB64_9ROSI|nr:hypothetical protein [Gossypium laxum]